MIDREFRTEFVNNIVEDKEFNLGLTISSVGYKSIVPNNNDTHTKRIEDCKYHFKKGIIRNEFKLIYITKGSGIICFEDSKEIEISEGKILLIYPRQGYDYYHTASEWKEYYMRFDADDYYFQIIKKKFNANNSIIDIGYNEEIVKLFHRAMDVVRFGLDTSQAYLSGMLLHALGLVIAASLNKTQISKEFQIVQKAKIIMNENIFEDIQIPEIASKLNNSYSSFRQLFKKETGISPAKFFNELKIKKAKQLLFESSYSVKEIAYMLYGNNPDNFYTSFKKNTGETPSNYKLSARNTT